MNVAGSHRWRSSPPITVNPLAEWPDERPKLHHHQSVDRTTNQKNQDFPGTVDVVWVGEVRFNKFNLGRFFFGEKVLKNRNLEFSNFNLARSLYLVVRRLVIESWFLNSGLKDGYNDEKNCHQVIALNALARFPVFHD